MLYVVTLRWRPHATAAERTAAVERRVRWRYPDAVAVLGEYWPVREDLAAVSIVETSSSAAVHSIGADWDDVFEVDICPAVPADEALRVWPAALARRSALADAIADAVADIPEQNRTSDLPAPVAGRPE